MAESIDPVVTSGPLPDGDRQKIIHVAKQTLSQKPSFDFSFDQNRRCGSGCRETMRFMVWYEVERTGGTIRRKPQVTVSEICAWRAIWPER
jgi:hypothetical protein